MSIQDRQIELITHNIDGIEENIIKGNNELKKCKEENIPDNTVSYKYIGYITIYNYNFSFINLL